MSSLSWCSWVERKVGLRLGSVESATEGAINTDVVFIPTALPPGSLEQKQKAPSTVLCQTPFFGVIERRRRPCGN